MLVSHSINIMSTAVEKSTLQTATVSQRDDNRQLMAINTGQAIARNF